MAFQSEHCMKNQFATGQSFAVRRPGFGLRALHYGGPESVHRLRNERGRFDGQAAAIRRWWPRVLVTLAAMAALTALTAASPARAAAKSGASRPRRRGDGPARRQRADHGDRVDQEPAGDILRRRRLDPARAGVERHDRTRDAGRRLQRPREGQGPPLEPL